jgi:hypothetical protein
MEDDGVLTPCAAARAMLDAFTSIGAERFYLSWTSMARKPRRPRTLRRRLASLGGPLPKADNEDWLDAVHIDGIGHADLHRTIPALLNTSTAERLNLILRPAAPGTMLIQLDDLLADKLPALAPAMFLSFETSPGSFQVWLAIAREHDKELARRVKRGASADLSATGATRMVGSFNFKREYAPNFPRVTIREIHPGRMTSAEELERLSLVAPAEEFAPLPPAPPRFAARGTWPSYAKALDGAPLNRSGDGPDRSRADYWWCFLAIQWGHGIEETAERLMQESARAREDGKSYADYTARNAAAAVERRRQLPGRAR